MTRIAEWSPVDSPLLSATDAIHQDAVEHYVYRDETGTYNDIPAVCCRRCGFSEIFSAVLNTHMCTTAERTERLIEQGMEAFRRFLVKPQTREQFAEVGATFSDEAWKRFQTQRVSLDRLQTELEHLRAHPVSTIAEGTR